MHVFDVLVGINLLREGLDLPEVSLVAILDADKEGFLRSETSLIQTIGRAARNAEGKVIMYADTVTDSMEKAVTETNRRREIQMKYNEEHGITPQQIIKDIKGSLPTQNANATSENTNAVARNTPKFGGGEASVYVEPTNEYMFAADPIVERMTRQQLEKSIAATTELMKKAAKELDFIQAAQYRDEIIRLQKELEMK